MTDQCKYVTFCTDVSNCICSASKIDAPHKELQSFNITDDLQFLDDDVNACRLETEHVHKVCKSHSVYGF